MDLKLRYKEVSPSECRTFRLGDDPELIHIIKSGFKDEYMIVYEDAHELNYGKAEVLTKKQIKHKFNIEL
jgi:hypothetical protein